MPSKPIIARRVARKKGLRRYYTGPCLRGHKSDRYTSTGGCVACVKEDKKGKYRERINARQRRIRAEYAAARDARDLTSAGR